MAHALGGAVIAALWTAGMFGWAAPLEASGVAALVGAGVAVGALWYWLAGKWLSWEAGSGPEG